MWFYSLKNAFELARECGYSRKSQCSRTAPPLPCTSLLLFQGCMITLCAGPAPSSLLSPPHVTFYVAARGEMKGDTCVKALSLLGLLTLHPRCGIQPQSQCFCLPEQGRLYRLITYINNVNLHIFFGNIFVKINVWGRGLLNIYFIFYVKKQLHATLM